ncbi:hypothetical protein OE88DRAFT_1639337 [Heliocybe sulcata]|uniref:Uncharacterized protein n=1 Tax=Heliocybe sulcata TaxID=5364 RepID=A0A5C3MMC3_9AGAM|nr:hypothetical protein OE88DRAFT_1639337 [Heliocybe sulcata]
MFYSRTKYIPKSNNIVSGLPPQRECIRITGRGVEILMRVKDVLNRIAPSYTRMQTFAQVHSAWANPRKRTDDARHLAKYILPRQYGLTSPFSSSTGCKQLSSEIPDFNSRECEIKMRGSMKTPKRVKTALPLLEQLIWKHVKCRYKGLCDAVCPSKLSMAGSQNIDSSIILVRSRYIGLFSRLI